MPRLDARRGTASGDQPIGLRRGHTPNELVGVRCRPRSRPCYLSVTGRRTGDSPLVRLVRFQNSVSGLAGGFRWRFVPVVETGAYRLMIRSGGVAAETNSPAAFLACLPVRLVSSCAAGLSSGAMSFGPDLGHREAAVDDRLMQCLQVPHLQSFEHDVSFGQPETLALPLR